MLGVHDGCRGSGIVGRFGSLPCRSMPARWRHSRPTLATSQHALHEAQRLDHTQQQHTHHTAADESHPTGQHRAAHKTPQAFARKNRRTISKKLRSPGNAGFLDWANLL
jgi:hypothetical protein